MKNSGDPRIWDLIFELTGAKPIKSAVYEIYSTLKKRDKLLYPEIAYTQALFILSEFRPEFTAAEIQDVYQKINTHTYQENIWKTFYDIVGVLPTEETIQKIYRNLFADQSTFGGYPAYAVGTIFGWMKIKCKDASFFQKEAIKLIQKSFRNTYGKGLTVENMYEYLTTVENQWV